MQKEKISNFSTNKNGNINLFFRSFHNVIVVVCVCVFIFAALVERILVDCHDIVEVVDSVELTFVDA